MSPLRRLPTISQLPVKFVWTSGRANKDKAWVFLEAIGYEPKTKQKPSVLLELFFFVKFTEGHHSSVH